MAKGTNADSRVIPASTSSNVNLSCWIEFDWNCPEYLFWYLNDNPTPLPESGDKYKVEVKDTYTECKKEFILSIFNVTENDEGKYSCQWECEYENTTKAVIELKVVDDLQRGKNLFKDKWNRICYTRAKVMQAMQFSIGRDRIT